MSGLTSPSSASAREAALNTCVEAVRRRGTVVQAGLHVGKASTDPMLWALKDLTIEATWCYPITMWPRIIGLVEAGKLPISNIIDGRIRADDVVAKGFDVLTGADNNKLKILVSTDLRSLSADPMSPGPAEAGKVQEERTQAGYQQAPPPRGRLTAWEDRWL